MNYPRRHDKKREMKSPIDWEGEIGEARMMHPRAPAPLEAGAITPGNDDTIYLVSAGGDERAIRRAVHA